MWTIFSTLGASLTGCPNPSLPVLGGQLTQSAGSQAATACQGPGEQSTAGQALRPLSGHCPHPEVHLKIMLVLFNLEFTGG